MKKELLQKTLKSLANSRHGQALQQYIDETIDKMKDEIADAEIDKVAGIQQAIKRLREVFRFLEKKKKKEENAKQNEYL